MPFWQLPIDETIFSDSCYFLLCSIWHLLGWWQMKTEINVLLMWCIYSGKDGLLLQNKTVIMFLSLVSGSFGSMNKSYVSPLHTAHLFSRLCHVTWCFEHFFHFFFFRSKDTHKVAMMHSYSILFFKYRQLPQTTITYKFHIITQGSKSNYISAVPSINTIIEHTKQL